MAWRLRGLFSTRQQPQLRRCLVINLVLFVVYLLPVFSAKSFQGALRRVSPLFIPLSLAFTCEYCAHSASSSTVGRRLGFRPQLAKKQAQAYDFFYSRRFSLVFEPLNTRVDHSPNAFHLCCNPPDFSCVSCVIDDSSDFGNNLNYIRWLY